jgi:putative Holliday junction resolvase
MFDKRIIGIDYGRRRIGVAYSDPLRITAQPLTTVVLKTEAEAVNRVCEALAKEEVELVVVGLPVSLSGGTGGQMADEIRKFAAGLEKRGYRVVFEDERFTSAEAMATMRLAGRKEKQMRGKTDVIAAQLILQGYLDSLPK